MTYQEFIRRSIALILITTITILYLAAEPNVYYRIIVTLVPKDREPCTVEIINLVKKG